MNVTEYVFVATLEAPDGLAEFLAAIFENNLQGESQMSKNATLKSAAEIFMDLFTIAYAKEVEGSILKGAGEKPLGVFAASNRGISNQTQGES